MHHPPHVWCPLFITFSPAFGVCHGSSQVTTRFQQHAQLKRCGCACCANRWRRTACCSSCTARVFGFSLAMHVMTLSAVPYHAMYVTQQSQIPICRTRKRRQLSWRCCVTWAMRTTGAWRPSPTQVILYYSGNTTALIAQSPSVAGLLTAEAPWLPHTLHHVPTNTFTHTLS
jgi:hypothetical protein